MKATEILEQGYHCNIRVKDFNEKDISIEQELDLILIEKSKLPDLIKILQSFVVMLLLSVSVFGQSVPKSAIWDSSKSDTVAVYMLVTKKVSHDYPLELRQIKGYSVTPQYVLNGTPRVYYLNIRKQPMPDDVIVWMAIQR